MNVIRRTWLSGTTALKASLAPVVGYEIPHDQTERRKGKSLSSVTAARSRRLGLTGLGTLAFTRSTGSA